MPDLDEFLRDELRRTVKTVDVNEVSSRIELDGHTERRSARSKVWR